MTTTPGIHRDDTTSSVNSATEETKQVAAVAAEEAHNVAGEAQDQVRRLVDETRAQAQDQAVTQRDRLVETLRTFSDDLHAMASQSGSSGLAADVSRQAAGKVRAISNSLDGRDPSELLQDLRGFARRRPGLFLFGALTAGVVAGRLARGAASSAPDDSATSPAGEVTAENPAMTAYPGGNGSLGDDRHRRGLSARVGRASRPPARHSRATPAPASARRPAHRCPVSRRRTRAGCDEQPRPARHGSRPAGTPGRTGGRERAMTAAWARSCTTSLET